MARQLTDPMVRMLGIMAEGHDLMRILRGAATSWHYYPIRYGKISGYQRPVRPYAGTIEALKSRKLIAYAKTLPGYPPREVYGLTEAGRRAAEGLADA